MSCLNLYDGARVRLRNGKEFTLAKRPGEYEYKWKAVGAETFDEGTLVAEPLTWNDNGQIFSRHTETYHDIVEVLEVDPTCNDEQKTEPSLDLYDGARVRLRSGLELTVYTYDPELDERWRWTDGQNTLWDDNGSWSMDGTPSENDIVEVMACDRDRDHDHGVVEFDTGAVRSDDVEGVRYDLVTPIGLRRVAETCQEGAQKYDDYNWERGMPISDLLNHAISHLYNYLAGDRTEDHLGHAAWGCLAACHSEELWPGLNENLRGDGARPPVLTVEEFLALRGVPLDDLVRQAEGADLIDEEDTALEPALL